MNGGAGPVGRPGPGKLHWALAALALLPALISLGSLGRDALRAREVRAHARALQGELRATHEIGERLAELRRLQEQLTVRIHVITELRNRQMFPADRWLRMLAAVPVELLRGRVVFETGPRALELRVRGLTAEELRAVAAPIAADERVATAEVVVAGGLTLRLTPSETEPPGPRPW